MRRPPVAVALALPLLGAASDPLAGRIAGPAENCITVSRTNGPSIVDAHTILYTEGAGRRVWKTGPIGACPSLEPLSTMVVEIYGGQLCRNDRFRVVTPGLSIPSAYCRFSAFTPYTRATTR
ncbi:hypothetical protein M9979_03160 [Sphingomonas sp. RP10(2022)]|uniref:Uncharacterized protein n=1 Tax=Sphingomonas liriopis TaxID=2949094 RepID=A0A9X2HMI0_9SPHN|nr:hypothetical protein [Sphingomonas liriopis]MCP3733876.1 hypothetical protein [Sphingomonas liriopis]